MKQKLKQLLLFLPMFFCISIMYAQDRQVTGTVSDESGTPLANVSYLIKGSTTGGVTSDAGNYSVNVSSPADVLVFTLVSFKKVEVTVGQRSTVDVTMVAEADALEEVVITALGIKREKKSLGYAVQEIKGDAIVEAREPNLANSLSGKVAGLQVLKSSNGPAGSSKIILRGYNSLTGDNQPLIVVDGVPVSNFTGASNNDYWNPSLDMGNGMADINSEDIASLSVLKGPSASALYGSRAGNGVILITTKTGKRNNGLGLTVSATMGVESLFTTPELQNTFGQGANNIYDTRSNLSWGPKAEGQPVTNWNGESKPLNTYDNIKNYFGKGFSQDYNVSFSQQYDQTTIYTSLNHFEDESMIPGTKLARTNLMARAVTKFGANNKWSTDTKIQYTNAIANNRPLAGNNPNNQYFALYMLPRSLDIREFSNPIRPDGSMIWYGGGNQQNPYWSNKYNLNEDNRDRFILSGALKYEFTSWLNAEVRGGADLYSTNSETKLYGGSPEVANGRYSLGKQTFKETNYSTLITAQKDNVFDRLGGSVTVGGNMMHQEYSSLSSSSGELVVPNLFSLNNGVDKATVEQGYNQKEINSVFGSVQVNWDGYLYLDATLRNDWTSTLRKDNRSFSYPSLSLSYVFTSMMNKMGMNTPDWLTYGKLRASYASVGNDLDAYRLYNTYKIGKDPNGNTVGSTDKTLLDPSVQNELIKSYEAGAELRLFQGRVGLDISFYKSNATNQLIALPMDPMSGFEGRMINAGNIENKGMEIMGDIQILDNVNSVRWNLAANYSQNKNTIIDLYEGITQFKLGGYDDLQVLAVTGQKYGDIYGSTFRRVTDESSPYVGQLLLNGDGLPQKNSDPKKLGNQQATGLLGVTNTFSYKGVSLGFQVDARFGGQIFSGTNSEMQQNGTAAVTVVNGERPKMVVEGVYMDESSSKLVQNSKEITTQQYWTAVAANGNIGINEANIYDASNVRLRTVQLAYSLPQSFISKTPFQKARVGVSCNNVWLISSHLNGIDPESVYATGTNAIGYEMASPPTTRNFLFNLTLGF